MSRYFVDAVHLIALVNPRDQWHQTAIAVAIRTSGDDLVTTEDVLTELLNFYSEDGAHMRRLAVAFARKLLLDVRVTVVSRPDESFLEALELYESRPDKGYSLTDCISMNVCRELSISEVLTNDDHFRQEGFVVLL